MVFMLRWAMIFNSSLLDFIVLLDCSTFMYIVQCTLGNDRTKNFCRTRTEPNLGFFFAEPNFCAYDEVTVN